MSKSQFNIRDSKCSYGFHVALEMRTNFVAAKMSYLAEFDGNTPDDMIKKQQCLLEMSRVQWIIKNLIALHQSPSFTS